MEGLTYRKMICSEGHESRPYAASELLPKRCPVCNQPYDRRIHGPFFCRADGTVPGEESKDGEEPKEQSSGSIQSGEEPAGTPSGREAVQAHTPSGAPVRPEKQHGAPVQTAAQPGAAELRRGLRTSPGMELSGAQSAARSDLSGVRRGRPASVQEQAPAPRGTRAGASGTVHSAPQREAAWEDASGLALYNGGDCIEIPEEGGILGREGIGQEFMGIDPLISRKHAFVKINRNGTVLVRDEGSMNGTYVDDGSGRRKLIPHETAELGRGGKIWLADYILVIGERK